MVVTQSKKQQIFSEFKASLRSFKDTEKARTVDSNDSILKAEENLKGAKPPVKLKGNVTCFNCTQQGHVAEEKLDPSCTQGIFLGYNKGNILTLCISQRLVS